MINRVHFFDVVSRLLYKGVIPPHAQDGLVDFIAYWDRNPQPDLRWFSYILATAFHETARTFQPIKEFGLGKGHPYGVPDKETNQTYFGRGLIQLTWKANYQRFGELLGIDLVHHPDIALQPDAALQITFTGMEKGLFTGKKLSNYFNETTDDWFNARKIINGLDKAALIAEYGKHFLEALTE